MTTTAEWADADSPLEAFPPNSSGARIGYARVSTKGQLLDRQIAALPRPRTVPEAETPEPTAERTAGTAS
ncbi:hypothetical protein ACWEP4_32140 [Streptomyces sp. NPDC004227]